ncbi:MAG: ribbon-helix-helix protein, CopG family [Actinobacteria bacterium]|jgi:predicted transcriptional regulator|nr:ribbon-helix-helix protein, CopG family [Actinomycetota bacterium]
MDKLISIRLSDSLNDDLQKISKEEDKSVSELVRESLKRYIAIYRFRKIRQSVLPFAEAQGYLTDEDIYNNF